MTQRTRTAVAAAGTLVLSLVALAVFVLPFAFPTPPPIITRFQATQVFSPDGDGRRDVARVSVRVREPSELLVEVRRDDTTVRTLIDERRAARGWIRVGWDGRDAEGRVVPDGAYALKLRARAGDKQFNTTRRIVVDTITPTITDLTVRSLGLAPPSERDGDEECRVTVVPGDAGALVIEVLPLGDGDAPIRRVGPRPARADDPVTWSWNGTDRGTSVTPGLYRVRALLTDGAGNRRERTETCWAGHLAGTVAARGAAGRRLGVRLRTPAGTPVDPSTPVELTQRLRLGIPGTDPAPIAGRVVGAPVRGRAGRVTVPVPRGASPERLWLLARTADGTALVDPA